MFTLTPTRWSLTALLLAAPLAAQNDALGRGRAAMEAHDPGTARLLLEEATRLEPKSYEANWRLALVLIDLGAKTPDDAKSPARDSLYAQAERAARVAVAAHPDGADGHFVLANALGRTSLTLGQRDRIRKAGEIRAEAQRAIALDPNHSGAWHVLGRWHAEVMRLSGLQKFFAKNFLGAGIFKEASWDEAEKDLRRAVTLDPDRLFHRLDLAEVLADREKWHDARAQIDTLLKLPPLEPMDQTYRHQAQQLGRRIAPKLTP